ncbi:MULTISPECIES: H-NS family histone-like protein [Vibrio]|uniref:DNA-binding protein n=1 Tax=Vibrio algicola TaxID=2662262 RepID=A0A5Q0TGX7_9VIBR|nr:MULTISPECIES: H-NS family nucleoid-associated regulatory protein [Vibrio]MBD1575429.1 H-NS histone family protein [Vibrio sp. S11_S32]
MSEIKKSALLNIRSLRAFTREEFTLQEVEELLEKLSTVYEERKAAEEQELAQQAERDAILADYANKLAKDGINLEDLVAAMSGGEVKTKSRKKREPRPAKYQYTLNGEVKTWTGQGRTPSVIQEALDSGKSIDTFLIK